MELAIPVVLDLYQLGLVDALYRLEEASFFLVGHHLLWWV